MKWVTLICLLLCTIVTESRHLHKRDAEHHSRLIRDIYLAVGEKNFNHILLVMIAQDFQRCSVKEHMEAVGEFTTFAKHCLDNEDEADCNKPMITIFHDKMCKHVGLAESYPWTVECCAKAEPERERCFHDHRDIEEEPFKKPDAEAACKLHKEHHEDALHFYIDTIAKRHPSIYPPAVLALSEQYNTIITECCEVQDKDECFNSKFPGMMKATLYIENKQRHVCHIISTFPERVYKAIKIAKVTQKYPAISFDLAQKFASESLHMSKDCCKGDVVECMVERLEHTKHICEHADEISPNLKKCCEKPLLERTPCMIALPNDHAPANLPKDMPEFVEAEDVCKKFADHQEGHLAHFLYEFARRHQELSLQAVLRVAKGYEGVLTKCCATENPVECYKKAPALLEAGIKESRELGKQNCDAYEHFGPYGYYILLLTRYVPKMPEVSDDTLLEITGKMTKFAGKCCALPEDQRLPCAEEKLDLLLGEMCEKQKSTFINKQVQQCCKNSYADRRPCFVRLGVDPTYKAPKFDESAFKVGADICKGTEDEQKKKRLKLLIHLLKFKPDLTKEETKETVGKFTTIREKCCAAADPQGCFDTEKPTYLLHLKALLAH